MKVTTAKPPAADASANGEPVGVLTAVDAPGIAEPLPPTGVRALFARPAVRKLLLLAVLAVAVALVAGSRWGHGTWPQSLTVSLDEPLAHASDWVIDNRDTHPLFLYFFGHVTNAVVVTVRVVYLVLLALGWPGVLLAATVLAWRVAGVRAAVTTAVSLVVCGLLGMWVPTMQTIALMVIAVAASVAVGALLGVWAGVSPRFNRILQPVLDTMQVLPAFAYLLPVVLVFGIGVPAATLATVVYAAPPMARLTALGLRGADPTVLEAVTSLGTTSRQRLFTARLPLARREIMLGVNQAIMMALSMVVIASVIGAGGLGDRVYQALSSVEVGDALAAGIPIVLLAVVMDRTTAAAGARLGGDSAHDSGRTTGRTANLIVAGAAVVCAVLAFTVGRRPWPSGLSISFADPVDSFVDWMSAHLYTGVPVIGGTAEIAGDFTRWVLDPTRGILQGAPWWSLPLAAAAFAWVIGTWRTAVTAALALSAIGVLGVWEPALDTLSQVLAAVLVTLVAGVAIGVAAARNRRLEALLKPLLDVMQTMPQFVYLIPVVALFQVGRAPAVAAAVVYALPAVIRITTQGIKQVNPSAVEAARSLGATRGQQLRQVQIPLARPALLLAVNQGLVLVLAVVIIGGLVGSGALGYQVVLGLATGDLAAGLVAGGAIVLLGVLLDRTTQPRRAETERDS